MDSGLAFVTQLIVVHHDRVATGNWIVEIGILGPATAPAVNDVVGIVSVVSEYSPVGIPRGPEAIGSRTSLPPASGPTPVIVALLALGASRCNRIAIWSPAKRYLSGIDAGRTVPIRILRNDGIEVVCVPEFVDVEIDDKVRTAVKLVVDPR